VILRVTDLEILSNVCFGSLVLGLNYLNILFVTLHCFYSFCKCCWSQFFVQDYFHHYKVLIFKSDILSMQQNLMFLDV
jgi:hypothetical protein